MFSGMVQARAHGLPSGAQGTYPVLSRGTKREVLLGGGDKEQLWAWVVNDDKNATLRHRHDLT